MKITLLYRPQSEHGRSIENFVRDLQARDAHTRVELLNIDSRDGSAMASLYDIMSYPAILVIQENGSLQQLWQGDTLPLVDEVLSYARV